MKKIRNLDIYYDNLKAVLARGAIVLTCAGFIGFDVVYYSYENNTQVIEDDINKDDTFLDENGNICHLFDIGEHKIIVSRNDAHYRNVKPVDGYVIENVEFLGWRDNNKTTYVNNKQVVAKTTKVKDGKMYFEDFGTIYEKEKTK